MFSKPNFGQTTTPSFGGFNSPGTTAQAGTATPFGQNAFSKPTAAATAFQAPSFGGASTTMFGGGGTQANTGMFGASATPAFGQQTQQPTSGFSGFNAGGSAPLFGSTAGVSGFAQPKPAFGGFGTNTSASNLFGAQPTVSGTTAGQPGSSLFNQTPNLFNTGFGNAGAGGATQGTPIKFNPVTGTDSMAKNGLTQNINTRHQCITCMKEYENKSLEELRLEDLQAGRKGPTGGDGMFGSTGQPTQNSLFGTSGLAQPGTSGTGFGDNKSLFGSTAPTSTGLGGFGTTNTGFGATSNVGGGIFGKPPGFGATTTTTASGFSFNNNTTSANPFGAAAQNKPFGTAAPGSLFGTQPSTSNVFGAQNTTGFGGFGAQQQQQQQQQGIGLFGQNKQTTFGLAQPQPSTSTAFNFGQNTANNTQGGGLFGSKPQLGTTMGTNFGSTSLFGAKPAGTTAAPAFGSTPFGAAPTTSLGGNTNTMFGQSTFGKPGAPTTGFGFGQTAPGTTANQGLGSGGMFGSTLGKPAAPGSLFGSSGGTMFGNTNTSTTGMNFGLGSGSAFGNQGLNSGGLGLGQTQGLNFNTNKTSMFPGIGGQNNFGQQNTSWTADPHQRMNALLANPFERPIFNGLPTDKLKELMTSTNPGVLKAVQSQPPSYSISTSATKPRLPVSPKTIAPTKKSLFEGLEPAPNSAQLLLGSSVYVTPSFEYKKLNLKPITSESSSSNSTVPVIDSQLPDIELNREPIAAWLMTAYGNPPTTSGGSKPAVETPKKQQESSRQELENSVEDMPVRRLALDELQSPLNDSNISASPLELSIPPEEEESPEQPHPANIKLRRAGYFTIPKLHELADRTDENGRCEVDTFTIGRENYGNIYFEGPMDVSNLNLDELVHIRHREVTVYPGDENKHPEGQGLNRKATITLDRVYPASKQNREPITNPEAIREMDYEEVLRRKCTKMGAQFIEYRPDTGSFVFKVQHFSKYEVNEDSDSEDVVQPLENAKKLRTDPKQLILTQQQQQQPQQQVQQQQQVAPHTPVSTMSQSQFLTPNTRYTLQGPVGDLETMDETIPEVQSPTDQLSKHANTDPCKMRLMKVSFFDSQTEELEADYQKSMQQDFHHGLFTTMVSTPPLNLGRAAVAHEKMDEEMEEEASSKEQHDVRLLRPSQHPALVNSCFDLFPPRITMKFTSSCADSALFMARAGTSSWGPRGSFLHIDGISIDQLTPYAASPNFKNWVERHLGVQLRHTGMVAEGSQVARRRTQPGLALLEEHCEVLNSVSDQGSQEVFIRQVLQLCLALWGSLPALQEDAKSSVVACKRKEALGEWLRDVIEAQDGTDETMEGTSLKRVLQHLNKGQLLDSVRTSQDNGEHYTALVMATAGSASTARQLLQRQLQEWVADRVSSLVNPLRLRCWLLAGAGLPLLPLEKGDTLNALQGLDWITCLAVHFWYLCSPGASIPDIVNRYEEAFSGENAYAAAPVPPGGCEETLDVRFHLLKLFSQRTYGLEQLLRVESHFPDQPLDTSLSWLLLMLLDSLNYTHVEEFCSQSIHLAFSEQLEAAGLWHWAIFILQHISNPIMRDSAVEQMIGRHVTINNMKWTSPDELSEIEQFVVSKLDVPVTMVFQAKAYRAACNNMHPETACFQLHAENWSGCHRTLIEHLAADAIITRNTGLVMRLLKTLRPHGEQIENWEDHGEVLLTYLILLEDIRGLKLAGNEQDIGLGAPGNLEALKQRIRSTANKISGLPSNNSKNLLWQCEMSKCLLTLHKSLRDNSVPWTEEETLNYGCMLSAVTLPDDYKLEEVHLAIRHAFLAM